MLLCVCANCSMCVFVTSDSSVMSHMSFVVSSWVFIVDTGFAVGVEVSGWSVGICGRGLGGATGEITGVGRMVGTRDRERNVQEDMATDGQILENFHF